MNGSRNVGVILGLLGLLIAAPVVVRGQEDRPRATRNVVFVTTDGLRPEEVFTGADEALLNEENGHVGDLATLRKRFERNSAEERRRALLPFFWGTIATEGQVYGNEARGSQARVTNGRNFSYPGYNEMLTGAPDDRIDSNDKKPNPNINVLEWLNGRPEYHGKVAAFTSWDVFPYILNRERSGLVVNSGWEPIEGENLTVGQRALNVLTRTTHREWDNDRYDMFTFGAAVEYLRAQKPRVLYISLGSTDEFAHMGLYDRYLYAANYFDDCLERLWATLQAMPEYQGQTSLIVSTDHGRGSAPEGWRNHGANVEGADRIWIGILGPDTPALGERHDTDAITQSQIAATLAALLGEDYRAAFPKAAPPIAEAIGVHAGEPVGAGTSQ